MEYNEELKKKFYLVGSLGRKKLHQELKTLFAKYSDSVAEILEKDFKKPISHHDIDYLHIGDIDKLAYEYKDIIIRQTLDLLVLKKADKEHYPNIEEYNIFVCDNEHKYSYYLFTLVGDKVNIILRIKARDKGYKLNRYGLWKKNTKVPLKFDDTKPMLDNVEKIIEFIYQ